MTVNGSVDQTWGFRPILFRLGNVDIPAYSFFVLLAIIAGVVIYYREARRRQNFSEQSFYIVFAALVGGALGAKIPVWIMNYRVILRSWPDLTPFLSGRTILGGMIGGALAVALVKRKLKIQIRIGNQIAPAAALGVAIGRIGCFFRGCCYGIPTRLSFGIDFGDGMLRHPTQLYDGLVNLVLFFYLIKIRARVLEPGKLFQIYLTYYFSFRFLIEFFREEPRVFLGLTASQMVSVIALSYMYRRFVIKLIKQKEVKG